MEQVKPPTVTIGDKVLYVPDEAHAFDKLADGTRAWDFELLNPKKPEDAGKALTDKAVADMLDPRHRQAHRKVPIKPLTPRCTWPAVVRGVGANGMLNLDVEARPPGCTHGYDNVPFAPAEANKGHSWHRLQDSSNVMASFGGVKLESPGEVKGGA